MRELTVDFNSVDNTFKPFLVTGKIENDNYITFRRAGREVLSVGTDYFDGYYPMFVSNWMPNNITKNKNNKKPVNN